MTAGSPAVPPLRIHGATVRFGVRVALQSIDLTVEQGEFVALTGPNGSGKTTLLRLALGFEVPEYGGVELFGDPVARLSVAERAKRVAWVPQEEAPRDNLPLMDYVLFGRYPHIGRFESEGEGDRAKARSVLSEVGLLDRADDGVLDLSGGERQRAILARTLAQEAPLLLLDEPTSHLDIGHQLDMLGRVGDLALRHSVTVVAALHDLNLAARFADRVVVLSRGHCVADGPPSLVLSEELLARVWGVAADLRRDPRTGMPYLLPHAVLTPAGMARAGTGFGPIHVVGGGGAASPILRSLVDAGYRVTAGALHLLDSDSETADMLRVPTIVEVPFAPLSEEVRARHRSMISEARAIVVAPFAVGPSNVTNLEDVLAMSGKIPIVVVTDPPVGTRDFTGGAATELVRVLLDRGAMAASGTEAVLSAIAEISRVSADRTLPARANPAAGPP